VIRYPTLGTSYIGFVLLFIFAFLMYFTGLDSLYMPSNGDEMVYSRIARLTAESGQWLPLVSDLPGMRNTKPPLLFWQAMVAGGAGDLSGGTTLAQGWDIWRLRLPSVVYSLLIAAGVGVLAARLASTQPSNPTNPVDPTAPARTVGWLAACVYLAFFSSFRFGRPYLTSAAETLWLCAPLACVLWSHDRLRKPSWPQCVGFGVLWGAGLLYKSFALVAPAAAGMGLALLVLNTESPALSWRAVIAVAWRTAFSALVALAVFGLWFVFDPDPQAVWKEFVVGENVGKLSASAGSLGAKLTSVAVQALAAVENAGPLAFAVLGLMVWGGRQVVHWRGAMGLGDPLASGWGQTTTPASVQVRTQLALAAWVVVWLAVFCLPSQRSARYVIPAMPAVAILLALNWHRVARGWFVASLVLNALVLVVLTRLAQASAELGIATPAEHGFALLCVGAGVAFAVAGLWRARWTRACTLGLGLALYAVLNATLAPFSGVAGHFDVTVTASLPPGTRVAVPSGFNAQHERYQFLMPGASAWAITPYAPTRDAKVLAELLTRHEAVVWQLGDKGMPGNALTGAAVAGPETPGQVLATRWDIRSRHQSGEIRLDNLLYPAQWAFGREVLVIK
jgi:4-amino-4-deoxy-L-arabinose transferase-like glycosyltransferase